MSSYIRSHLLRQSSLVFIGLPLLIWASERLPERSLMKELFSILTVLSFFLMINQIFWTRSNQSPTRDLKVSRMIELHKVLGYLCVIIILIHPLFLVVPGFFEPWGAPAENFITILTTFNLGVILGIIAWLLTLVLGATSLWRHQLPMKYKTWRMLHGILASLVIVIGAWHVLDMGRHINLIMSVVILFLAAYSLLILFKLHTAKNKHGHREA